MSELIAFLLALGTAWLFNGWLSRRVSSQGAPLVAAIAEETWKTGAAFICAANVAVVHLLFGLTEGGLELKKGAKAAAMAAVFLHTACGLVTVGITRLSGYLLLGWVGGVTLHFVWNLFIILLTTGRLDRK